MANEIQADYASGSVLYAVIRDRAGRAWCAATQSFEDWGSDDHTATDYALGLTDQSGSRYVGDFDPNIPAGEYFIQVFVRAGAAPADTDTLVGTQELVWTGARELTAIKLLANSALQDKMTGKVDYYDDDGQTVLLTHLRVENASTCSRTRQ
ncbi:MAG: hypothetical protein JW993_02125 [Sedimentisphaerales bacterium]|nr:hypothetical protein [Sedimentisphaerales bacterium]